MANLESTTEAVEVVENGVKEVMNAAEAEETSESPEATARKAKERSKIKVVKSNVADPYDVESSRAWHLNVVKKTPNDEQEAKLLISRIYCARSDVASNRVKIGLNWLILRQPLASVSGDEEAAQVIASGICSRKLKDGTVKVYNGLGLAGYKNQEEAAEALGLAVRSPRTGKLLMRELSTCILAARAHIALLAFGVEKGMENPRINDSVRSAILSAGIRNVVDNVGMISQFVNGIIRPEDVIRSIKESAKRKSSRGIESARERSTNDLVKVTVSKLTGLKKYITGKVRNRVKEAAKWCELTLRRKDIAEEQTDKIRGAMHEALHAIDEMAKDIDWNNY